MTAIQVGERIGESPATCSFHPREAGAVPVEMLVFTYPISLPAAGSDDDLRDEGAE